MRTLIFIFAIIFGGCANPAPQISSRFPTGPKTSVIYVGMAFEDADSKLKSHGSREGSRSVALAAKTARKGMRLHQYVLPGSVLIDLISKPGKAGRVVASIAVSKYTPKPIKSMQDPELFKFEASFVTQDTYDLDEAPNK